jgi:hypothetical protein
MARKLDDVARIENLALLLCHKYSVFIVYILNFSILLASYSLRKNTKKILMCFIL